MEMIRNNICRSLVYFKELCMCERYHLSPSDWEKKSCKYAWQTCDRNWRLRDYWEQESQSCKNDSRILSQT